MSHTSLVELNSRILTFLQEKALVNESAIQNKQNELNITTSQELQKTLNELTNTDRLLRVGIIGRVKAGKSSLLNALVFDGNDILPKAATPMTAALTRMEYSEEVRAEMEFYDQADLAEIERKSTQYLTIFEANKSARKAELLKEREEHEKKRFSMPLSMREPLSDAEIEKRAEDFARSEAEKLIELSSAYDQFQRIQQANISREELEQKTLIKADSTAALMGLLNDYVGSSGKYMPFTKSVKLYIPEKGLKGLEIVDTPGVNDPVQSREQRTNEFLSNCDVVFVVSPSGQFLSEEDMRLMGRVTSREGIKEAYIIASQVDNQLFGSEKENEFSPLNVLKKVEGKLDKQAKEMLSSRKGISEEILALYQKNSIADNRQVVLNNIEQQNVELIQARLNVLGTQRKQLVEQLHSLKSRGQTYVRESVKIAFEEAQFEAFQQLLAKLDYDALHKSGWSKKVVDNGELELTYQAEVQGDKLTISFQQNLSDKSVLRLSEDVEWTIMWHFQLLDGKLRWRKTDIAG